MKIKVIIGIVVLVLIVGLVIMFTSQSEAPQEASDELVNNSDVTQNVEQPVESYTAQQVAQRNTETDCWTIINDEVYDLTSYIPSHPGGDEVLRACGTDSTTLFFERKTEDGQEIGSGNPHSSRAQGQLGQYKIGTLAQ